MANWNGERYEFNPEKASMWSVVVFDSDSYDRGIGVRIFRNSVTGSAQEKAMAYSRSIRDQYENAVVLEAPVGELYMENVLHNIQTGEFRPY